jgi:hypothetical protein
MATIDDYRIYADSKLAGMRIRRYSWWLHWRELADFILPRRYRWLVVTNQMNRGSPINQNIIDSTGTLAARVLASGMMAGITSPTRPWFKFKVQTFEADLQVGAWLAECERRMMAVFQESNFYTAMGIMYFDLVVFGSACIIIYEDFENVIHCYNPCAGEYFFELDPKFGVNQLAREFTLTHQQIADMFGIENVTEDVKQSVNSTRNPGQAGQTSHEKLVAHLIEPNVGFPGLVPKRFPFREIYWEWGSPNNKLLRTKGFMEWPGMCPRWDVVANDPYGRSPAMDALGDIKQLQQETRRKAQAIDKMVNPPMIADVQLKNQPASTIPGGWTYVAGLDNQRAGAKPLYTIMPPIAEMKQDIAEVQNRIKITFHNDLFTGISDLTTVRTATEIDARREEKLVLLGPVLERIIGEGLGKAIDRTWGIMMRGGLLPPPPPQLRTAPTHVEVDYISMLALAQRGIATAGIEKLWSFAGSLAAVKPEVLDNLDEDETIDEYADALGVSPKILRDRKIVDQMRQQRAQQQQEQQLGQAGMAAVQGAQTLSKTDIGGGKNALAAMLGNETVQ